MERQKPVNSVQHNDAFSQALIESYGKWVGGAGFGWHLNEDGIPTPEKKELGAPGPAGGADASTSIPDLAGKDKKEDDFSTKDPKTNAAPPDPAANLRTGQGMKYSVGAEIRDTTKVVAREGTEGKQKCPECGGKGCSHCGNTGVHKMKKEDVDVLGENCCKKTGEPECKCGDKESKKEKAVTEGKGLYANIHAKRKRGGSPAKPGSDNYPAKDAFAKSAKTAKKEEVSFELNGETYIFEREVIEEGSMKAARKNVGASTCWKGYKAKGTKKKGGKSVPNCVKEYFEKDPKTGKMVKKHNCAKKVKKEGLEYSVVSGEHTMLEDGTVTHYDIIRENIILHNVPVEELEIMISEVHEHVVNDDKNREVLGEKKLDPVGKADADIDNDGDVDKSDKYLHARRKKVTKLINTKKKMKEQAELQKGIEEEKK